MSKKEKETGEILTVLLLGLAGAFALGKFGLNDKRKYISEYYDVEDFTRSDTAKAQGYTEQYQPSDWEIENGQRFAKMWLDPIAEIYGKDRLHLESWYRGDRTNAEVGGSPTSTHLDGGALDMWLINDKGQRDNIQLYKTIRFLDTQPYRYFDQLILEGGTIQNPRVIHFAQKPNFRDNRNQILFTADGKTYLDITPKETGA